MSDLLTHWAVFEDCRRLMPYDPDINDLFKQVIEEQVEFARLGAITRRGNQWMPPIIKHVQNNWDNDELHPRLEEKLAFVVGALTHQSCDHYSKPLFKQLAPPEEKRQISAYYDVQVFRKVYLDGHEDPFNTFMFADNDTQPGQALEGFTRSLFQRALLSSHTLIPDDENVLTWLDNVFDRYQNLYISVEMYVDIYQNPDPAKMEQYQVETTFYDETDSAIQVCRALQAGKKVSEADIKQAFDLQQQSSAYAKMISLGMIYLRRGSLYWAGEVDTLDTPNAVFS